MKIEASVGQVINGNHAMFIRWKTLLILIALSMANAAQGEGSDWWGGKPDTAVKSDRCMLYEWFFQEADDQTDGKASQDDFARSRVINIANKLADHHGRSGSPQYSAKIRYLVSGEKAPYHFSVEISGRTLDRLLEATCDELERQPYQGSDPMGNNARG